MRERPGGKLLQAGAILLVEDQPVEDRQHLLAVGANAAQIIPETGLKIPCLHPFFNHGIRHINILPQCIDIMPAQE